MPSEMEIIVVDDEPVMRQMLGRALARFGYSVTQCSSGEGAIREVENREGGALLVLDYAMPQINGAEVCQKIRSHEHPGVAQTPIILLTAFGGE